ncbi:Cytochrome P450 - like 10 [Theobroma cacao]|nr:Cytochrome P450 - like 10 [Theobroma cacao]
MIAAEHLGFNYAMAGVAPYGSYWREMRKIINFALLSNRRLEILKQVRVSEAQVSVKELYKTWSKRNNGSGHVLVEMKQWFGDLTLNVIVRMVAGKRYFGSGAKGDDKEARRCQRAMREWFHLLGVFALKDAVPFLGFLDLGGHEKAVKETAKELESIASEWLKEHKQKRASGGAKDQDFMDVLLSLLEGTNLASEFDVDTINKANCLLDIHVGKERLVNESDLSKLECLQAVVKETLRLHPPVLLFPRFCTDEIIVSGYHVPRDSWIFLNLWKIQTDPRVWSDPLEFMPERFLTTNKDFDVGGDQYFELIPFGFGRRVCPGMSFGLQMVHVTLASLLQAFDISTPSNAMVDMTEGAGLSNMKATALDVLTRKFASMDFLLADRSTCVFGLVAILFFSYYLFLRSRIAKSKNYAPIARGAWPIIGHLPLLRGPKLPHLTLGDMAEKYGPIYAIRLGVHPALVVSSWEILKEIFTNHDVAVASRLKVTSAKHMSYDYAMFGFSPYGPYWREMRKIVNLELLSNHKLELLKHVRVSEVETSLKELYKLWAEKKDSSNLALVEMKQWFGDLALNVIFRMVAGKRYFGTGLKGHDKEARRCQRALREWFHLLGVFVLKDAVPLLGFLDLGGQEKAMKETAKEMDSIASEWLKEHKQKRTLGEVKEKDFMDVLLSLVEAESTNPNLSGWNVDTITKTTCLALARAELHQVPAYVFFFRLNDLTRPLVITLSNGPELDIHVGKERLVNDSDLSNLIYLQAVVKETLRLYPPALLFPRLCTQDITLNGYHVSKGTWIFLNLWKIQTDPRVWSDPYEFKPERFLSSHKEVDVRGRHFEMIPFGCGRRVCPGISFGLQVLNLTLAGLLHGFDISTPSNARVDMTESPGLTSIKATPLEVLITPRLSPNSYG